MLKPGALILGARTPSSALSAKREQFCAQPGLELFDKGVCSNVVLFAPAAPPPIEAQPQES